MIKQADGIGCFLVDPDIKRYMLVHGIPKLRIVANRVLG